MNTPPAPHLSELIDANRRFVELLGLPPGTRAATLFLRAGHLPRLVVEFPPAGKGSPELVRQEFDLTARGPAQPLHAAPGAVERDTTGLGDGVRSAALVLGDLAELVQDDADRAFAHGGTVAPGAHLAGAAPREHLSGRTPCDCEHCTQSRAAHRGTTVVVENHAPGAMVEQVRQEGGDVRVVVRSVARGRRLDIAEVARAFGVGVAGVVATREQLGDPPASAGPAVVALGPEGVPPCEACGQHVTRSGCACPPATPPLQRA